MSYAKDLTGNLGETEIDSKIERLWFHKKNEHFRRKFRKGMKKPRLASLYFLQTTDSLFFLKASVNHFLIF